MDEGAINLIQHGTKWPNTFEKLGDHGDVSVFSRPGKDVEFYEYAPPPPGRRYTAESLDGLLGAIAHWGDPEFADVSTGPAAIKIAHDPEPTQEEREEAAKEGETAREQRSVVVFVGSKCVTVCFDESGNRRHWMTWKLGLSEPLRFLLDEGESRDLSHSELLWALQHVFSSRVLAPDNAIQQLEGIRWKSRDDGEASAAPSRQSVSRQALLEVSGLAGGALPSDLLLRVPVYDNLLVFEADGGQVPYEAEIRCSLRLRLTDRKFDIVPKPGEVARVLDEARDHIADTIESHPTTPRTVRVLRGAAC